MSNSGKSIAQRNKAIRQDALREQLSARGLTTQVLENITKLEDLDNELDSIEVQRIKTANELRMKLINKYLPDLKSTEIHAEIEDKTKVDGTAISDDDWDILRAARNEAQTPPIQH